MVRRTVRKAAAILVILAGIQVAVPAWASQSAAITAGDDIPSAAVQVDGRTVFTVRGSPSVPASERAERIAGRIREAARNPAVTPADVTLLPVAGTWQIMAGAERIMTVFQADGDFESLAPESLAGLYADGVRRAIDGYRANRSTEHLTRGALVALAASAGFALLLWLLNLVFRHIERLLERLFRTRVESLPIGMGHGSQLSLWRPMESGVRTARLLLRLVLVFVWLQLVLAQFPWTRWIADNLGQFVVQPVVHIGEALAAYLPSLFFLLVLFAITRYSLRLLKVYFGAVERGATDLPRFDREWSWPTYKIVRAVVLALALVMAYPYLPGSGTEALKGVSVFAGLLISLGASSAVSGVISGYLTTFGRVFKAGDLIKVGEVMGVVTEVRLLTTRVRTIRNEEVTIPNATITTSSLVNYSVLARTRGLVLQTEVGIGYEVPWRQVHAMLVDAAARTPVVLKEPAPFVRQKQLGDFAVVYQLNAYKDSAEGLMDAYSALHQNILDVFNEHGVQIMTPAYEGDPAEPKIVPREQWYATPAQPPAARGEGPAGATDRTPRS